MADFTGESKMAEPMIDPLHSYAKKENPNKADQKVPSFMSFHCYSKPVTVECYKTPVKMRNPKRQRATPTGTTPKQPTKRSGGVKWTDDERKYLFLYLQENPPEKPISNSYWRGCADFMNTHTNEKRTGASCRGFYNRFHLKEESSSCPEYSDLGMVLDVGTEADRTSTDTACQTDISIPPYGSKSQSSSTQSPPVTIENNEDAILFLKQAAMMKTEKCDSVIQSDCVNNIMNTISNGGSVQDVACCVYKDNTLKQCLWSMFLKEVEDNAKCMTERKQTYLSDTTYDGLVGFEWHCIIDEMARSQQLLVDVLLAVSTSRKNVTNHEHYQKHMKEIGLIYGILMKRRYKDLSRVQRFIGMALASEKVHQKVYDRLQTVGVTISHSTVLKVQKKISGHFSKELIEAVQDGKTFRIVGDNVNFMAGVSHQRKEKVQHMEHWFASAAIIQQNDFSHLSLLRPQQPILDMSPNNFIPQPEDWNTIRFDYIISILEVLIRYLKCFATFKPSLNEMKQELLPKGCDVRKITPVIPLTVMAKNEQKYSDVVDILDSYEQLIQEIYDASGKETSEKISVHIGGDQLTRERFSGAKRLRSGALTEKERLSHLSPITFEMFHLQMNVLTMFYKLLYNKNSTEPGTLYAEKVKLSRSNANGDDVKNHYDDCKELAISVIDAYVVEAALEYFEMETIESEPQKHLFQVNPATMTDKDKKELVENILGSFVDKYILQQAKKDLAKEETQSNFYQVQVLLPDGRPATMLIPVQNTTGTCDSLNKKLEDDGVEMYAHRVLEIGMAFKTLLANIKTPNRDRMLPLLKYLMCLLKGHNNKSKYALEILRFIANQLALLDEKTSNETFYGLFVNTKGKFDTSFAADLEMEHIVRLIKGHLKAVHSNKRESVIARKTSAFSGLSNIASKFDKTSSCIIRSQKHTVPSAMEDERLIIDCLHRVRPFNFQSGRSLPSYKNSVRSPLTHLKSDHFKAWIKGHLFDFQHELGQ